ncbi:MAG TPA: metalloregulator ArsR/SmtB family transcription factor [Kofleriaceae bacterium]|nr:metalloregulator ArsR/SmtB family transcription factor [Kofleriaceae bacterium]
MRRSRASTAEKLVDAAPVFAALGDATRLRIVARLCAAGPQSIVRLTDGAQVTRQAITKHLHALAEAGLVRSTRAGRERIWEIQPRRLTDASRYLEQISAHWDEAIGRLRAMVEDEE